MINPNEFGKRVKIWRAKEEFTQVELSEMVGITSTTLSFIERGRQERPSFHIIMKLCSIIGESPWNWVDCERVQQQRGTLNA